MPSKQVFSIQESVIINEYEGAKAFEKIVALDARNFVVRTYDAIAVAIGRNPVNDRNEFQFFIAGPTTSDGGILDCTNASRQRTKLERGNVLSVFEELGNAENGDTRRFSLLSYLWR